MGLIFCTLYLYIITFRLYYTQKIFIIDNIVRPQHNVTEVIQWTERND